MIGQVHGTTESDSALFGAATERPGSLGLTEVTRVFPGHPPVRALDGITLHIPAGQYVAITGRSGSGKSTLLNVLGLLERTDGGTYCVGDRVASTLPADELDRLRRDTFGFVFQAFHLLDYLTVAENVDLGLTYVEGMNRSVRHERIAELLSRVQLDHRADALPATLSGGEKQRVAIARALAHKPSVLLADEPTGNLDERTSGAILALFEEIHAGGVTVIVVTHDESTAVRARRRITIRDGRVAHDTNERVVARQA